MLRPSLRGLRALRCLFVCVSRASLFAKDAVLSFLVSCIASDLKPDEGVDRVAKWWSYIHGAAQE